MGFTLDIPLKNAILLDFREPFEKIMKNRQKWLVQMEIFDSEHEMDTMLCLWNTEHEYLICAH